MNLFDFSDEKPKEEKPVEPEIPDIFIPADNSKLLEEIKKRLWGYPLILIGTKVEKKIEYVATIPIDKTIAGYTLREPKNSDPVTLKCEKGIKFFNGNNEYDTTFFEALLYLRHDFVKFKYGILFGFEV